MNEWRQLANVYLQMVKATEAFADLIDENETLDELCHRDGYTNAFEWVEWVYDPDKEYTIKEEGDE